MVDCFTDKMLPYMHLEEEANKGGKTVSYLLMWHLEQYSIAANSKPTTEFACKVIDFFFDKCSVQNKNRMIL